MQKILSKSILAAQARAAARKARELVQRKSVLTGGGLPGKLADCSDRDPERCEFFLVEGIRQVVLPNREVTEVSRPFFH